MNNRILYIIIGSVIIAVVLFILFFQPKQNKKEEIRFSKTDWRIDFKPGSKNPYGTFLFYELLKHENKSFQSVKDDLSPTLHFRSKDEKHDLLILFEGSYEETDEFWQNIVDFIDQGNSVFFIQESDPAQLKEFYKSTMFNNGLFNKTTKHRFEKNSEKYDFEYLNNYENRGHYWEYFDWRDTVIYEKSKKIKNLYTVKNSSDIYELYIHEWNELEKPVFVEFVFSGGRVYIHRNPLAFTNLYLIHEKYVRHMEKVISVLNYDAILFNLPSKESEQNDERKPRVSPLQFILANKPLSWAYYILIGGLLLFFFFNLKRKQKPVPVLPPKQNTTLEFVDAVSKVYYQKHNNKNLVGHKYRIFTTFIRTRYHISFNKDNEEYIRSISIRSGIKTEDVEEIIHSFDKLNKVNIVSDEQLISIHKLIDTFYKNCK